VVRTLGVLVAALSAAAAAGEEARAVRVETVEYAGWAHNLKLSNGTAELVVTLDVGPRVISYRLADGRNVFGENADELGKSGEPGWVARGGHRLWTAPEDLTRTYSPDNGPVGHDVGGDGVVRVRQPVDRYGIRKEMAIRLEPTGSRVTVTHRIIYSGNEPTELAAWALTVLAPGGVEIIPLPPKRPHPGPPERAALPADYAPNQKMVLWPFTDLSDPRYTWGGRYVLLRQDGTRGPTKIGMAHGMGWVGYVNRGTLFVKRFEAVRPDRTYPDGGCNFETFTNQTMLEAESLVPLVRLAPNESVEHVEHWELFDGLVDVNSEADVNARIMPKVGK
jgi:hypothetical protein